MEPQLQRIESKLSELEAKIDATYRSSERMRKYFLWAGIITVAVIVIPLLIIPFLIPAFLQSVVIPPGL